MTTQRMNVPSVEDNRADYLAACRDAGKYAKALGMDRIDYAAAPELLAACEAAIQCCEQIGGTADAMAMLRTAISKAKGGAA